jgi:voltage-gated potassium channel
MDETRRIMGWVRAHRWAILLVFLLALLMISSIPDVYDSQDNLISPLMALVVLAVTLSTGLRLFSLACMTLLTVAWLVISVLTPGSGLFAGQSIVAPALFLVIMGSVFLMFVRWMVRVSVVNAEALCAAVCGYLILGIFWADIYTLVRSVDQHAIVSPDRLKMEPGDLLYFSYTTLTTTGFGDLIPRNPAARMWSVLEAVIGTFYNAIVIARFVTLYGFKPAPARAE